MILAAQQLQEKYREQHQDLFMTFVDLSKAFNTVSRELLWGILLKCGCPDKCVNILSQFHDGMMAPMAIGGQESFPFGVSIIMRQGCAMALVLFNIFHLCVTQLFHKVAVYFRLDGNLFNIRRLQVTTKVLTERVLELRYADDCTLVAHTPEDLQSILVASMRVYSRMGLSINTTKTEVVFQWRSSPPPTIACLHH